MDKNNKDGIGISALVQLLILIAGLALVLAGIILLLLPVSGNSFFFIRPIISIAAGGLFLYLYYIKSKKSKFIFCSVFFVLSGILLLLTDAGIIPYKTDQLWPAWGVICGIALLVAGFFRYKRFHPVFFVTAVVLCSIGVFFLLFSLNIIEESLSYVVYRWWPILLIIVGTILIGVFFSTRHFKNSEKNSGFDDEGFDADSC
ncbi:MAG: DUF5668 domain-containing protein [Spirochaetaceae bacterium]|jgi:uncharacterized membrane protein YoaK (UPF0700 family)|nr:DUF5668 domain-containing protein [Spirochaetaceae bacterium]